MKRPLTKDNKKDLESLLLDNFREELELDKHKLNLELFLTEHFINYLNEVFGKELIDNFKKCRESLRITSTPTICSYDILSLDPDFSNKLKKDLYDEKYYIGSLSGDSPEQKFNLVEVLLPNNPLSLSVNTPCPNLSYINKDIFYKNSNRSPLMIKEFISEDKIEELLLLFKEYYTRSFIITNSLRLFRYSGYYSTTYSRHEFLWNIKTWEDLKDLNIDWYNLLNEHLRDKTVNENSFDISKMTINEIFDGLDDELGL